MLEAVVRGASLALAGLFLCAVAHKVHVVRARTAADQPLIRLSPWRRRHAGALLVAAGLLELAVAASLIAVPAVGFAASGVLAAAYARELRRLPPGASCNCFGAVLAQGRTSAIHRNLVLSGIGAAGGAAYATGAADTTAVSQAALGVALMAGAAIAAAVALTQTARGAQRPPMERE